MAAILFPDFKRVRSRRDKQIRCRYRRRTEKDVYRSRIGRRGTPAAGRGLAVAAVGANRGGHGRASALVRTAAKPARIRVFAGAGRDGLPHSDIRRRCGRIESCRMDGRAAGRVGVVPYRTDRIRRRTRLAGPNGGTRPARCEQTCDRRFYGGRAGSICHG